MSFEDFFLFFRSELWKNLESVLSPTSILLIVFFISVIIWALAKSSWLEMYILSDAREFRKGSHIPLEKKAKKNWQKIKKRLRSNKEANWKLAVIEGEEIVEDLLLKIGYKAKDLRSRLLLADEVQIPNLRDLLEATETYEKILNDPDYKLSHEKAEKALNSFEEFLKYYQYL